MHTFRNRHLILGCTSALWLWGCMGEFELQSQIARVRVLGVRSEPAELVLPASGPAVPPTVQLEALALAPEGRVVTVQLAFCRPFANVYAADFECPGKDGVALPDGRLSMANPEVLALLASSLKPGASAVPDGGPPADPFEDPVLQARLALGLKLQVGYEASDGTEGERGLERGYATVVLRRTDQPNRNPELVDLQLDGGTLEGQQLARGQKVELSPVLGANAQETFLLDGVETQEAISLSWFATGEAQVADFRSVVSAGGGTKSTTQLTTPEGGGATTVWVVARDGRGGTSWLSRSFSSP